MFAVADTDKLVRDGVLSPAQAREIETRARAVMMELVVDALLVGGVLAAAAGLIFWLADAAAVAGAGLVFGAVGLALLMRGGETLRFFGGAAALIGAGMLLGGAAMELMQRYKEVADPVMLALGAAAGLGGWAVWRRDGPGLAFVGGAILLMGLAVHLLGLGRMIHRADPGDLATGAAHLWFAAVIAWAGWRVDVRLVSAAAIVPFAQVLDTGTFYRHAAYAFYSPESTLTILQMSALVTAALLLARRRPERDARHLRIHAMMGFVVANLSALVGSLWGDVVGESWVRTALRAALDGSPDQWDSYNAALAAWREGAITIPEEAYSIAWAAALAGMIAWAAIRNQRGLFNAGLTFAGIHFYTQLFESMGAAPEAFALAGLMAIPLAWGAMKANKALAARDRARAAAATPEAKAETPGAEAPLAPG
ncbi:hypothetical protein ACQ5SO_20945 [Rhodovulum sp. DZ06]|uniref:hypothetical protein n=1 Tax=Rhodovulum sp. DZ06 TaxID=3425126 RepID=UPI003D326FB9